MNILTNNGLVKFDEKKLEDLKILLKYNKIPYKDTVHGISVLCDKKDLLNLISRINNKDKMKPVLSLEEFKKVITSILREFHEVLDKNREFTFFLDDVTTQSDDEGYFKADNCIPFVGVDAFFDWEELENKIESLSPFKECELFDCVVVDKEYLGENRYILRFKE